MRVAKLQFRPSRALTVMSLESSTPKQKRATASVQMSQVLDKPTRSVSKVPVIPSTNDVEPLAHNYTARNPRAAVDASVKIAGANSDVMLPPKNS